MGNTLETNISLLNEDIKNINLHILSYKPENSETFIKNINDHIMNLKNEIKSRLENENIFILLNPFVKYLHVIMRHDRTTENITTLVNNEKINWIPSKIHFRDFLNSDSQIRYILRLFIVNQLKNKGLILAGGDRFFNNFLPPDIYKIPTIEPDFETRDPAEIVIKKDYLVYPGHKFKIMNFDGKYGIVIDKSNLIILRNTVRESFSDELEKIYEINKTSDERVILRDCCPNFNCEFALNGNCELSPLSNNTIYYFENFNKEFTPYNFKVKGKTLLQYALERCKNGEIEKWIEKKPPIIIVKTKKGDIYNYPPERLRESLNYSKISDREERQELMEFIKYPPFERREGVFKQLKNIMKFNIIGNYYTFQNNLYEGIENGYIEDPMKIIGHNFETHNPFELIKEKGPLDIEKRKSNEIDVTVFADRSLPNENIERIVNDLVYGIKSNKPDKGMIYEGIKFLFKYSEVNISPTTSLYEIKKKSNNQIVIGVLSPKNSQLKNHLYNQCFKENLGVQCIIGNPECKKYLSRLKRISLGLYLKLGLNVWKLKRDFNLYFIGIKKIYSYFIITLISPQGELLSTLIEKTDNIDFLIEKIKNKLEKYKKLPIEIHWDGQFYGENIELKLKSLNPIKIISIKEYTNPIRIFDRNNDNYMPNDGSFIILDSKRALLISSSDIAKEGSPQPIMIESLFPDNEKITVEMIKKVYYLSRVNQRDPRNISKLPVTTHYAKIIWKKFSEIKSYPSDWQDNAWFF